MVMLLPASLAGCAGGGELPEARDDRDGRAAPQSAPEPDAIATPAVLDEIEKAAPPVDSASAAEPGVDPERDAGAAAFDKAARDLARRVRASVRGSGAEDGMHESY
jgi:hypothetical protein